MSAPAFVRFQGLDAVLVSVASEGHKVAAPGTCRDALRARGIGCR